MLRSFLLTPLLLTILVASVQAQNSENPKFTKIESKDLDFPKGALILPSAQQELKINLNVEKFILKNGLTVLLLEDHSIPLIAYHTWYKVGSNDEKLGVTGAAHMLEHMMFKGAKKYSGKDFDRIFHENGIVNNAFTSNDYTGFHQTLPSGALEKVMEMEVDRMSSLLIRPEDLLSEKEVVAEERRWRVDNNPRGMIHEKLMGLMFKSSNYRWPVIGDMKDINGYTSEKLRYFYETFYLPNNAVLVLVGDFESKKVKPMIEKYYGQLKSKEIPKVEVPKETQRTKPEFLSFKGPVQTPNFVMAFQGVAVGDPDLFAMDLLANILGSGNSSRLYKDLVERKTWATSAYAYSWNLKHEGMIVFGVALKNKSHLPTISRELLKHINRIKKEGVSREELAKVKVEVMKNYIDQLLTIDAKAQALAVNEIVTGSYQNLFEDLQKYEKVTAEDIKRVAQKYLNIQGRVELTQLPQ